MEDKLNEIGGRIDTISTLLKALISSLLGTEELTKKDAGNLLYILEEKVKELKIQQNEIISSL